MSQPSLSSLIEAALKTRKTMLPPEQLDAISLAVLVFQDRERAVDWLSTPHPRLDNMTPGYHLLEGHDEPVRAILLQKLYGV